VQTLNKPHKQAVSHSLDTHANYSLRDARAEGGGGRTPLPPALKLYKLSSNLTNFIKFAKIES